MRTALRSFVLGIAVCLFALPLVGCGGGGGGSGGGGGGGPVWDAMTWDADDWQ